MMMLIMLMKKNDRFILRNLKTYYYNNWKGTKNCNLIGWFELFFINKTLF